MRRISEIIKMLATRRGIWIVIIICLFAALIINVILSSDIYWTRIFQKTKYVIEVTECERDGNIYMLVLVGSHPDHIEIRNVIRKTWGNPRLENYTFKLVFLFGKITNPIQWWQIQAEHKRYGDILAGDFVDSYHNVTVRDMMGLEWATQRCPHAKFIMRADDDVALDIYQVIRNLEKYYSKTINLIACFKICRNFAPHRSGRYAISRQEYPDPKFPDFCGGQMYLMTPTVAQQLIQASVHRKLIWLNDVYITGMLIQDLSLRHQLLHLGYAPFPELTKSYAENFNFSSSNDVKYEVAQIRQNVPLLMKMQEIYKSRALREKFILETIPDSAEQI